MAKYRVVLDDARVIDVYAPDEAGAKAQAKHQETSRVEIAAKRGHKVDPSIASPASVSKLKD